MCDAVALVKSSAKIPFVENGINGGSSVVGKTAKKITISSASSLPAIIADMDTSAGTYSSNTVNIPLFIRYDWTDSTSHQDLWWIPHGIRWPVGTQSVVGGVVVSGINALPNYFVANKAEFKQALTNLSGDGGIIVPTVPITIDEINANDIQDTGLFIKSEKELCVTTILPSSVQSPTAINALQWSLAPPSF